MSSVFQNIEGKTIKGFAGKEYQIPFFIQFVPGYVVEVVTGKYSLRADNSSEKTNSIIAIPHLSDKVFKRRGAVGEGYRYYPLLRGITDVPSKGDPVLLCSFGSQKYYLGPLNSIKNSPTFNEDPHFSPEIALSKDVGPTSRRGRKGESLNFNRRWDFKRLEKMKHPDLDYGNQIHETPGDMMLEGRHGNSIRIGSRNTDPYMFFSNGRNPFNNIESIVDGTLISVTQNGTLAQHFGGYTEFAEEGLGDLMYNDTEVEFTQTPGFILASDMVEENKRLMGALIGSINNVEDSTPLIYDYDKNQVLITSDRITFNTREDDMFLSSNKDIHIGTGRHLTISTNENLIIESKNTYLGDPNKLENKDGDTSLMEPMVLGKVLLEILKELTEALSGAQGLCQGAPIALADDTGAPGTLKAKIGTISGKLDTILSQHHFVEPNKSKE